MALPQRAIGPIPGTHVLVGLCCVMSPLRLVKMISIVNVTTCKTQIFAEDQVGKFDMIGTMDKAYIVVNMQSPLFIDLSIIEIDKILRNIITISICENAHEVCHPELHSPGTKVDRIGDIRHSQIWSN